jgi:outer membrane protein assembly factor BamE (lipoprotein component of BamABCDE complex)
MVCRVSLGLCWLLLAGCVSLGNEKIADEATVGRVKVGETTREQVLAMLGEPDERRRAELADYSQEWWAYQYEASQFNPLEYLLIVGLFYNGIGTPDSRTELHVFFDQNGVVRSLVRQATVYDMGAPFIPPTLTSRVTTAVPFAGAPGGSVSFQSELDRRY